jgi:hypothetical protein
MMSTVGQPKAEVLARMAKDINPEIDIKIFPEGVNKDNLKEFLTGVDLYVDALDFFAFDIRQQTFAMCAELGIPGHHGGAAGHGRGPAQLPAGPDDLRGILPVGRPARTGQGDPLRGRPGAGRPAPPYLVVPEAVNFAERRGPSTFMACQLCAGIVATEALKILLGRGKVLAAPHGMQFDAYRNKLARTWRPGGNGNPLHRLMIAVGKAPDDAQLAGKAVQA